MLFHLIVVKIISSDRLTYWLPKRSKFIQNTCDHIGVLLAWISHCSIQVFVNGWIFDDRFLCKISCDPGIKISI